MRCCPYWQVHLHVACSQFTEMNRRCIKDFTKVLGIIAFGIASCNVDKDHPGLDFTRLARDIFETESLAGRHHCIAYKPQGRATPHVACSQFTEMNRRCIKDFTKVLGIIAFGIAV
jgi:hypothetical protein